MTEQELPCGAARRLTIIRHPHEVPTPAYAPLGPRRPTGLSGTCKGGAGVD
jgi:hypothetical protein